MAFENIIGLWALTALIILIILYLRRPKPLDKEIPSLMFLMKQRGTQKKYKFFRRLLRNLILILQILTITAIAFALAEPYINIPKAIALRNTVVVIDTSASSQVKSGISTRFEEGIKQAKKNIKGSVSIIAASQIPTVLLEKGSRTKASSLLQSIEPTDTPTNIEAAMYEAESILKEEKGNIVVISDFITTQDNDQPLKAKRILSSKGHIVKFIDTSNKASNVGIINLDISKKSVNAYVKNYNGERKKKITIKLLQNSNIIKEYTEDILPNSVEIFKFPTQRGVSKLELDLNDDFKIDNYAYISTPERKKITVVLITNLKEGEAPDRISRKNYVDYDYLTKALKSSPDIDLHIIKPPRMTITTLGKRIEDLGPEIIISHKVNNEDLIKHAFIEYSRLVDNGSSFIVTAQNDLEKINFEGMLPVKLGKLSEKTKVCIDIFNYFTKRFQEIRCFTNSRKYYTSIPLNSTVVIASADDNSPMIALKEKINGKLVYYGIFDDYSDFKLDEDYPIFWDNLISFLIKEEDIREYNRKFEDGAVLGINKVGIYEKESKFIAVNLLNERESDISKEVEITSKEKDFISESEKALVPLQLAIFLLIISLVLMFIEIIYIKFRGDI